MTYKCSCKKGWSAVFCEKSFFRFNTKNLSIYSNMSGLVNGKLRYKMRRGTQCKKGWSGVLCSEKQVLANAAAALLVKLLHPWNAPTATAEKCQKSNREIWKSVRALSQEIHLETCNEENLKWRSKKIFFSKSLLAFSVIHHCMEFGKKAVLQLCQRIQIPISCKKLLGEINMLQKAWISDQ